MPRPSSSSPAAVLRAALAGPYPAIREAAILVIRSRAGRTHTETARQLGVARSTWFSLLADFPEISRASEENSEKAS